MSACLAGQSIRIKIDGTASECTSGGSTADVYDYYIDDLVQMVLDDFPWTLTPIDAT